MHIQIKSIFSPHVIFEGNYNSLKEAVVAAIKQNVSLRGADLREANLRGADLRGADLRRAGLREADLWGADLRGADLRGANLWRAHLQDADLRGADLRGADLRETNLWGADLRGADLRKADLRGADSQDADLRKADLRGAYLFGEKLKFTPTQISRYKYHILIAGTKMRIGCRLHSIQEWRDFKDEQIKEMDGGALDWWKEHKPLIMPIALKHLEDHNKIGE